MKIRRVVLGAGLLAGVVVQVHAQAIELRFHPSVGQITHYRMLTRTWTSADTTAAPANQVAMYQTQTVVAADSGTYTVKTETDSTVMAGGRGGRPGGDMMRGMAVTVRMDGRGRVLSTQVTPPPGLPPFVANMMTKNANTQSPASHVWPEGAIHPGDTWTDSMVQSVAGGHGRPQQVVYRVTYKYERLEEQGGHRVAIITINGVPDGGATGSLTGTIAADLDASRMVRMATGLTAGQGVTRMTMEMLP